MIKDISIIRKELDNFIEVSLPYDFKKNCLIKYITLKNNEESFYKGGRFQNLGNDCLILSNNSRTWSVPTCFRNKDGSIDYISRFFIEENEETTCDKEKKELQNTIQFQQSIIEKLTKKLEDIELQKKYILDEKSDYEELLQQNRYHFKELSIQSREKDEQLKKYEDIIQKLSASHPFMR